ncbi:MULTISPECIES: replication initiator protein A [Paraburkholderia]|uniref:Replication initiator protein A n=1 Tax=Paraburkholderia madseniana TaxID=2599607 RepID=A0AAP5BKW3_9BURK|nr:MULTISPECIES: replication initiator protein A [Paraburkholderia]MCX4150024.1 replication initiator protein A [Paraburkholderia madseniana]MCX4175685.1 replication initiator protein A [Paraburkholderia madseniana]MDN7152960.1 replication initiator protein A [Paraburkholderia sp. WS6]MDQ6411842.1 replication initiator protein A [Paraburkholderia madseniana]MDQ6463680.1 replication initiator protein A [Paraburkholderia madseniana]
MATILEQAQEIPVVALAAPGKTTKALPRTLPDAIDLRQELDDGPSMADGTSIDEDEPTQFELFQGERLATAWKPREDLLSLEFPLFSLQKGKDTRLRIYRNGEKIVQIIPSVVGAANIFDKDLLVYAATLISKAADAGMPISRRIRFKVRDFLVYTGRSTGGRSYTAIVDSCRRLKGTNIETNFISPEDEDEDEEGAPPEAPKAGQTLEKKLKGFGLITDYEVTTYTSGGEGALELELILSRQLYKDLRKRRVLMIHHGYFNLNQGIQRRLYDLAKKHCGDKLWWKIGLDNLHAKSGSAQALKYFRRDVVDVMKADSLPEFHIAIDTEKAIVVFFRRDRDNVKQDRHLHAAIHREIVAKKLTRWYYGLLRWDSHLMPPAQHELLPA